MIQMLRKGGRQNRKVWQETSRQNNSVHVVLQYTTVTTRNSSDRSEKWFLLARRNGGQGSEAKFFLLSHSAPFDFLTMGMSYFD